MLRFQGSFTNDLLVPYASFILQWSSSYCWVRHQPSTWLNKEKIQALAHGTHCPGSRLAKPGSRGCVGWYLSPSRCALGSVSTPRKDSELILGGGRGGPSYRNRVQFEGPRFSSVLILSGMVTMKVKKVKQNEGRINLEHEWLRERPGQRMLVRVLQEIDIARSVGEMRYWAENVRERFEGAVTSHWIEHCRIFCHWSSSKLV